MLEIQREAVQWRVAAEAFAEAVSVVVVIVMIVYL